MIYRFGDFELDEPRRELRCKGNIVPVEPKMFQVLHYLIDHRDRVVVPKDELLDQCWPDAFVTPSALNRCLSKLRQLLHRESSQTQMIKTVHRQGYRFVAEVVTYALDASLDGLDGDATVTPPHLSTDLRQDVVAALPDDSRSTTHSDTGLDTEGERRQLTVLFCDLVGSTALSEQLDPEDLHEVLQTYYAACGEVVDLFDGHIAQYLGDGLLVYFGYPVAHEDASRRLCRFLGMIHATAELNLALQRDFGIHLAVRVGIHTGLVVMSGDRARGRTTELAVGATPNIAARIQAMAQPSTVLVSESTRALIQGYFILEAMGAQPLTGVAEPMALYRVLRKNDAQSRLDVTPAHRLTPFVGREVELILMQERWRRVQLGQGQIALLVGEAGIGKSRLVQRLKNAIAEDRHMVVECRCSPYYQHTAFYPVIDVLQRLLQIDVGHAAASQLRQLEDFVALLSMDRQESVSLLAPLFGLTAEGYETWQGDAQQLRQRTMETLLTLVLSLSERQPVLLVVEDIHWIDPSTLEWLGLLIDQGPTACMLTLMTSRPEFQLPWPGWAHVTSLTLEHLSQPQIAQMVTSIAGSQIISSDLIEQIVTATDGVPLFVEEMTQLMLASESQRHEHLRPSGGASNVKIPTTLQDSLMARLDAVGEAKRTAQLGATIGGEFAHELLELISPLDVDASRLQQDLDALLAANLIYQRGAGTRAVYWFKHALIQEAAATSLLRRTRQGYHHRLAQTLEMECPHVAATQPELVAQHYSAAGEDRRAVDYWHQAGDHATQRSAHQEAISHFHNALACLDRLPPCPQRVRHRVVLYVALAEHLELVRGLGASEVERAYAQAYELCLQLEDNPFLNRIMIGLFVVTFTRGDLQQGRILGQRFFVRVQHQHDSFTTLMAHLMMGSLSFIAGEFTPAYAHLTQGLAVYQLQLHPQQQAYDDNFHDVGVALYIDTALSLWMLGYVVQARVTLQNGIAMSRERSRPYRLAWMLCGAARLYQYLGEFQAVYEHAEASVALAREWSFAYLIGQGEVVQGEARVMRGEEKKGIEQLCQGLAAYRDSEAEEVLPYFLALLAESYGRVGETTLRLATVEEALAIVERHTASHYAAELHRLKGELLLLQAAEHGAEAEACFQRALDIARLQRAISLELRAALSVSRLWQRQGKAANARCLLASIYDWFSEGFDTPDLKAAEMLLRALK